MAYGPRCANVGKITRINAVMGSEDFRKRYPRSNPNQQFRVIDGYIDILLPSISSGAAGVSIVLLSMGVFKLERD